jgi:nanoRNase/pAp phosphatase (c-di-AMP/oligoRNAs hydrolase)
MKFGNRGNYRSNQRSVKSMWEEAAKFIRGNKVFLLTTHINPEGDAIGSEVALRAFLETLGKSAVIVNSSPTPENCAFLDPDKTIKAYPEQYDPKIMDSVDGLIILDVNGWIHLGPFAEEIKGCNKPSICIDHHEGFENEFVDILVSDTTAASAGLLVYELIKYMGGDVTTKIAEAVYASLIADERAFKAAAELRSKGADPYKIHKLVFANRSWEAARLIGPVLNTLESAADGKIAWICMTKEMRSALNARYEDGDGLIDLVRAIKGVALCLFFKEVDGGKIKVSLRSNGTVDAYKIARRHGGGGHRMAAGMSLDGGMEKVVANLIEEILAKNDLGKGL